MAVTGWLIDKSALVRLASASDEWLSRMQRGLVKISTVTLLEDTAHTFAASEFGYSDVDGDALKDIVIVSLPASGLLTLGTDAVTLGQVILATQIPDLKWTPPASLSGAGLASFTFRVVLANSATEPGETAVAASARAL